jgi:hypothetical protein
MTPKTAAQVQMDALGENMQIGFKEVKEMLQGIESRVRGIENQEAGCQPLMMERLAGADAKIKRHDQDIEQLKDIVKELAFTNTILKWVLGLFTVILGAVLIGFATGQLQVVVR